MENSTGNADKKNLRKQAKMIKQRKDAGIWRNKKEKATRGKIRTELEEINQKVLAKEGRLKRYRQSLKQCRKNRTFQNNERKFYQQLGDDTKTYQQPDAKATDRFWTKIWQPRKHNKKNEWINNMTRELEGLKEGPKVKMHIDLLKMTLINIKLVNARSLWNTCFLVWKIHLHDRLALGMNRCLQEVHVPEWITKGTTTLIQKTRANEPPQTKVGP